MFYTCLITNCTGRQVWTEPAPADNGRDASRKVTTSIRSINPIHASDKRPSSPTGFDGVWTTLNWNYIVGVAAFPVFT